MKLKLLCAVLCLFGVGLAGCSTLKNKTAEEQQKMLSMWSDFAKQNRLMLIVQASHNGRIGFYEEATVGLDAGSTITATFLYDPDKGLAQNVKTGEIIKVPVVQPVIQPATTEPGP